MSTVLDESSQQMPPTPNRSVPRQTWRCRRRADSGSSRAWTPGWTRRTTRVFGKATPTSSAMPEAGRATMPSARIVISYKLLGTAEWFVIHHTDCGMEFFTDETIRGLLANSLETAALGPDGFYDVGHGPGSAEGADIDWLCIADQRGSVVDDVRRIRNHPLVPDTIPVYGFLYDVRSGRLIEVKEATAVGRAA